MTMGGKKLGFGEVRAFCSGSGGFAFSCLGPVLVAPGTISTIVDILCE